MRSPVLVGIGVLLLSVCTLAIGARGYAAVKRRLAPQGQSGAVTRPPVAPPELGDIWADPAGARFEKVYEGGVQSGWVDYGWCDRAIKAGPASLNMQSFGGWILAHPDTREAYDMLILELRAPPSYGDFLGISIGNATTNNRELLVDARRRKALGDGRFEVRIPVAEAYPGGTYVDRFQLRAMKAVSTDRVEIDRIRMRVKARVDPTTRPARTVAMRVRCNERKPISPLIYGIAYGVPRRDEDDSGQWALKPTARRWGGNPTSRYNWRLGNAWNSASDYFFMNVNYAGDSDYTWSKFLDEDVAKHVSTTLTVPTLGWVAKDTTSYSFSVARDGRQQQTESYKPDVGNGLKPDGKPLQSPSPTRTSVAMSASDVGEWVQTIRARDAQRGQRSVDTYILDNEPALWSSTHRDVHPEPLTYDELLEKTIAYGTAVRRADPDAKIAGPAEWGWPAYFFSAKDAKVGFQLKPDRRAHGDVPLIEWYLQKLRDHERASGVRILDVVDLHFYPQGPGIYGGDEKTDPATSALRIRMTRGLWDPTYRDESWIDDTVMLIPRMQAVIERSYPGRRFSIGEWSFGGEGHMSGALAVAESLGRFGQSGLYSAYYWTKPKAGSPAAAAWRAYRDYDGSGGHFLDDSAATTMGKDTSLFASVDSAGKKLVAIALNLSPEEDATARIDLDGCGIATGVRTFRLSSGEHELRAPRQAAAAHDATIEDRLPAYSITVFEVALHAP